MNTEKARPGLPAVGQTMLLAVEPACEINPSSGLVQWIPSKLSAYAVYTGFSTALARYHIR